MSTHQPKPSFGGHPKAHTVPPTAEQVELQSVPKDAAMLELLPRGDAFAAHKLAAAVEDVPAHLQEKLALFEQSFSVLRFPHKSYTAVVLDPPSFDQTFHTDTVVTPNMGGVGTRVPVKKSTESLTGSDEPHSKVKPPTIADVFGEQLVREDSIHSRSFADHPAASVEAPAISTAAGTPVKQPVEPPTISVSRNSPSTMTRHLDTSVIGTSEPVLTAIPDLPTPVASAVQESVAEPVPEPVPAPVTSSSSASAVVLRSYFPNYSWSDGAEAALCERHPLPVPTRASSPAIRFLLHAKALQLGLAQPPSGREIEPLFCEIAVYQTSPDARAKLSDTFSVQLSNHSVVNVLEASRATKGGDVRGRSQTQHTSPFVPSSYLNSTSQSPCTRALFSLPSHSVSSHAKSGIAVVLLVYKVMQGKLESVLDIYAQGADLKDKHLRAAEARAQDAAKRWGEHRQLMMWSAAPLFTESGTIAPIDFKELYRQPKSEEAFTLQTLTDAAAVVIGRKKSSNNFKQIPGQFVCSLTALPSARPAAIAEAEKIAPVYNSNMVPARMEEVVEAAEALCIGHEMLAADATQPDTPTLSASAARHNWRARSGTISHLPSASMSDATVLLPQRGKSYSVSALAVEQLSVDQSDPASVVAPDQATTDGTAVVIPEEWVEVDYSGQLVRRTSLVGDEPLPTSAFGVNQITPTETISPEAVASLPLSPRSRALVKLDHKRHRSYVSLPDGAAMSSTGFILEVDPVAEWGLAASSSAAPSSPSSQQAAATTPTAAPATPSSVSASSVVSPVASPSNLPVVDEDTSSPFHLHYTNHLYVYPQAISFSDARNVVVGVQIKDTHESANEPGLELIYPRSDEVLNGSTASGTSSRTVGSLISQTFTAATYHCYHAAFLDEIKIELPLVLKPTHHLLFTFYNVSCKSTVVPSKDGSGDDRTLLGYSMLPLYLDNRIVDESYTLPVCSNLRPHYLLQKDEWDHRRAAVFSLRMRVHSSLYTNDPFLNRFFLKCALPYRPSGAQQVANALEEAASGSSHHSRRPTSSSQDMVSMLMRKVLRSGHLKKKGGLKWTDRWWTLNESNLIVFKSHKEPKAWHHTSITPRTNTLRNVTKADDELRYALTIRADGVPVSVPEGAAENSVGDLTSPGAEDLVSPSSVSSSSTGVGASPAVSPTPQVLSPKSGRLSLASSPPSTASAPSFAPGLDAESFESEMVMLADSEDEMFSWLKTIAHAKISRWTVLESVRGVREAQVELLVKHLPMIMRQLIGVICCPESLVDLDALEGGGPAALDRMKQTAFETLLEVAALVEHGTPASGEKQRNVHLDSWCHYIFDDNSSALPAAAAASKTPRAARPAAASTVTALIAPVVSPAKPVSTPDATPAATPSVTPATAPAGIPDVALTDAPVESVAESDEAEAEVGEEPPTPTFHDSSPPTPSGSVRAEAAVLADTEAVPIVFDPLVQVIQAVSSATDNSTREPAAPAEVVAEAAAPAAVAVDAAPVSEEAAAPVESIPVEVAALTTEVAAPTESTVVPTVEASPTEVAAVAPTLAEVPTEASVPAPLVTSTSPVSAASPVPSPVPSPSAEAAPAAATNGTARPAAGAANVQRVRSYESLATFWLQLLKTGGSVSSPTSVGSPATPGGPTSRTLLPLREHAARFSWLLLDMITKSLLLSTAGHRERRVSMTLSPMAAASGVFGATIHSRGAGHAGNFFKPATLKLLTELVRALTNEIYSLASLSLNLSKTLNKNLALFLRDAHYIFPKTVVFDWISLYLMISFKLEPSRAAAGSASSRFKFTTLQIIADHEHYVNYNSRVAPFVGESKEYLQSDEYGEWNMGDYANQPQDVTGAAPATKSPTSLSPPVEPVKHNRSASTMSGIDAAAAGSKHRSLSDLDQLAPMRIEAARSASGRHFSKELASAGHFMPFVLIKQVWLAFRQPGASTAAPIAQDQALSQAAYTLRSVLLKHELDARYQTPKKRSLVASMYVRILPCLWNNLDRIKEMRSTTPGEKTGAHGERIGASVASSTARKDLIACALYVLNNLSAAELLRHLRESEYRVHEANIRPWFFQFLDLLSIILETVEYAGPIARRLDTINTAGGAIGQLVTTICARMMAPGAADGPISDWGGAEEISGGRPGVGNLSLLESKYTPNRGSTMQRKSIIGGRSSGGGTLKKERTRARVANRTLNSKTLAMLEDPDAPFHTTLQCWERLYAHESAGIVLHTLKHVLLPIAQEQLVQSPDMQDRLLWFLHGFLRLNQSDQMLLQWFDLLRSLLAQHAVLLWPLSAKKLDTTRCRSWWFELLRHLSFHSAATRDAASSFIYDLFLSVSQATGSTSRVQAPLLKALARVMDVLRYRRSEDGSSTYSDATIVASGLTVLQSEGRVDSVNDAAYIGVLSALAKSSVALVHRAAYDPRRNELGTVAVVQDIGTNFHLLQKIIDLSAVIHSTKAGSMDPDSLIEHCHSMARLYARAPRMRLLYLKHMYDLHMSHSNLAEAGATQLKMFRLIHRRATTIQQSGGQLPSETPLPIWNSDHTISCLRKASELFEAAELYEQSLHCENHLIAHWVARKNPTKVVPHAKRLASLWEKLSSLATLGDTRSFGTFYRVGFYGTPFQPLGMDGREFVYREPNLTKLPEITSRLVALWSGILGREVTVFKDSGVIDRVSLTDDVAKLQVTAVLPFFAEESLLVPPPPPHQSLVHPPTVPELTEAHLVSRESHFEKNTALKRFFYDTPYTKGGKSHGTVETQYKKRSLISLSESDSFPSFLRRLPVASRTEIDMTPLQCVLEDVHKRIHKLVSEARPPLGNPDIKTLTQVLSGSVNVQVNGGTAEVCQVFLSPDNRHKWDPTELDELRVALGSFVMASGEALGVAIRLANETSENKAFIEVLQVGYTSLVTSVKRAVPDIRF